MVPRTGERPKTIVLVGDLNKYHREGRASEAGIYPGMLIELDSDADDMPHSPPGVSKHTSAGADCPVRIVKEDYLQGKTINDAIDYGLVDGENQGGIVMYHHAQPGDVVLARVASGTNWAVGTQLGSAGNGLFAASGTKRLLEVAEAYDGSADTTYSLVRCEVL